MKKILLLATLAATLSVLLKKIFKKRNSIPQTPIKNFGDQSDFPPAPQDERDLG